MDFSQELEILRRGAVEIIQEEELIAKLSRSKQEERPLRIKFGADPTAPDIHLGHTVLLRKLRQFQDLGHEVHFIIGDFTARIGDPSGRDETRPSLTQEEIQRNATTYQQQIFKVLTSKKTFTYYNSKWLENLSLSEVLKIASFSTVAQILDRDDFKKRHQEGKGIGLHEFLYPLLQGYDSVALRADVEIGGTDQKFNLLVGRELQKAYEQKAQVVLTMPLLEGTDGARKMSKSFGNYIGIDEDPHQIFGKLMSIPDELLPKYLELLTILPVAQIVKEVKEDRLHPKEAKLILAKEIVRDYYDEETAETCASEFERIFKEKGLPSEIEEFRAKEPFQGIVELLFVTGLTPSKSEARRLIKQGGVRLNQIRIDDPEFVVRIDGEHILQVGRRKFVKIVPQSPI
ncbi:TPA: tyrosine--tRNA ligase [bacterium]|nr:tyrosine--tRNA ligase [bacterium]